jgi:glycosyltransferase involved in cell wall biosynthesis
MVKVSVIIAAYQGDQFLKAAIASALAQTYSDFEILVVDDAASPATAELVRSFGDPRLHYHANPECLGVAANHWSAFQLAQGDYIAILNQDDMWSPSFLETMVRKLDNHPDCVLAFSDHHLMDQKSLLLEEQTDQNTRRYGRDRLQPRVHQPFDQLLIRQSIPMVMAGVFRKSALREEDRDFFVQSGPAYNLCLAYLLCRTRKGAYYHPERLTSYRVHAQSATSRNDVAWSVGSALVWSEVAQEAGFASVRREARRKASEAWGNAALAGIRRNARAEVLRHAVAGLRSRCTIRSMGIMIVSILPGVVAQRILHSCHLFLLAGIALMTGVIVEPGGVPHDTGLRLQASRSLWTNEPAVMPGDNATFALVGTHGRRYPPYGIGQSLVMLPWDIWATIATEWLDFPAATKTRLRRGLISARSYFTTVYRGR